jgi:hypothetical protein
LHFKVTYALHRHYKVCCKLLWNCFRWYFKYSRLFLDLLQYDKCSMWPKIINLHISFQISSIIIVHTYKSMYFNLLSNSIKIHVCSIEKFNENGGGVTFLTLDTGLQDGG